MRKTLSAVILIAALPAVAAAQAKRPSAGASLPPIGLPLPPIGLPLPSLGLPPPTPTTPPVGTTGRPRGPRVVYFVPMFDYWGYGYPGTFMPPAPPAPTTSRERKDEPREGTLRFDVQPEKLLQVFVDGYYVGTPNDFDSEITLEPGTHAIELTAPGYESVKFEVKIDGSRPITYRGELKLLDVKPVSDTPPAPVPPSTLYYIPGCYLGNVDPNTVPLPANCDMSKLVTKPAGTPR